jgi:hypothetical protein
MYGLNQVALIYYLYYLLFFISVRLNTMSVG